jgi:uncharacterized membrane protein YcjF (UPF0283 family)
VRALPRCHIVQYDDHLPPSFPTQTPNLPCTVTSHLSEEALTDAFSHIWANDDHDDTTPAKTAGEQYSDAVKEYNHLVRLMLIVWDCLFGGALALWIVLRVLHRWSVQELQALHEAQVRAEAADEWRVTRRSQWSAQRQLLTSQMLAFTDVAKPMER